MPSERKTLLEFHESHFPSLPVPPLFHPTLGLTSSNALHELESLMQEDDVLGYYEDGVKRTLTDEQIAIFRHTEIQGLLRERRERPDAAAGCEPTSDLDLDQASPLKSQSQPSMPLEVDGSDIYEATEDHSLCNDNAGSMDWQMATSKQHLIHLDYVEQDTGRRLPAEYPESLKKNTYAGMIISHDEEHDLAQTPDQTAVKIGGEGTAGARFVWPALREQY